MNYSNVALGFCLLLGIFDIIAAKQYYLQLSQKLNWYAAFESCAAQGLQLATINSQEEQNDLDTTMRAAGRATEWMWTSGTDQAEVFKFVWMSTGQPFGYTSWSPREPDNAGGHELCVHVWPAPAGQINWNDWQCSQLLYYICEDKVCTNSNNCGCNGGNSNGLITTVLNNVL